LFVFFVGARELITALVEIKNDKNTDEKHSSSVKRPIMSVGLLDSVAVSYLYAQK